MTITSLVLPLLCLGRALGLPTCPRANIDRDNPGRCGPKFGSVRCNTVLADYALYCNEENGWCGNTDAHKNAQASDIYDSEPTQCQEAYDSGGYSAKTGADLTVFTCTDVEYQSCSRVCSGRIADGLNVDHGACTDDCEEQTAGCETYRMPSLGSIFGARSEGGFSAKADQTEDDRCETERTTCQATCTEVCLTTWWNCDPNCLDKCMTAWGKCDLVRQVFGSSAKRRSIDPPAYHVGRESSAKRRVTHQAATAPIAQDVVPTSLYLLGAFIAIMLACIAGVLCFAICVQPLVRQMGVAQKKQYELVDHVDEQL